MSSKNLQGSATNAFVHMSGYCANFPQMLFRQSLATVQRPALYTMSSWLKYIFSCARTRSMKAVFHWGIQTPPS